MGVLTTLVFFGLSSGNLPLSPTANADSTRLVSLYVDGQKRVFGTDGATVGEVLRRSGVVLGAHDLVEPALTTPIPNGFFNVNVYRSRPVEIQDGYKTYYITSADQSPHLLAAEAGLKLYPEDAYEETVITNVVADSGIGVKVTVKRALPITLIVDGVHHHIRTQATTVGAALAGADVALGLKDTVSVPLGTPVVSGMVVTVTRVQDVVTTVTTKLPFKVTSTNDPNLPQGQTKITTPGVAGSQSAIYAIHYRNGVETSRDLVQLLKTVAAVTQVEVIGTEPAFVAGSMSFWQPTVLAVAAQYSASYPNLAATMICMMKYESNGNALDVSTFPGNPTGLFQFKLPTWVSNDQRYNGGGDNILNGAAQIQITAKMIANGQGREWSTFRICS